tara:strand:- start:45 stop:212 length:168 start_codon:yes stop_codon:yes gene_type:complete
VAILFIDHPPNPTGIFKNLPQPVLVIKPVLLVVDLGGDVPFDVEKLKQVSLSRSL